MDGDLQNEPEDIPKLLAALDRADVASGRRVARRDSAGPHAAEPRHQRPAAPLHRRPDLRLRLRVQRLPPRRDRADARRDRPAEVHEGARRSRAASRSRRSTSRTPPSQSGSRYSPLRLVRLALHVVAGLLAAAGAVDRRHARRSSARSPRRRSASTASSTGSSTATSPGRSSPEQALCSCSASRASSSR